MNITLDAFFLIASSSLAGADSPLAEGYTVVGVLTENPFVPDRGGRDILLAGLLLQKEQQWQSDLTALLCAAILEEKKDKAAFELLRQWTEIVLQLQHDKKLYGAFVQWLVVLGREIRRWCLDWESRGITKKLPFKRYKDTMMRWQTEGRARQQPLAILAWDVLHLLDRLES